MNPAMFSERLRASAVALGWQTSVVDTFTARQFRGHAEVTEKSLPKDAIGLRLGDYPILVASIELGDLDRMHASLRSLHTQMVIARSYMAAEEVINAHIMLIALAPDPLQDWRGALDLTERDETVCRKLIWTPNPNDLDQSYALFAARTFLATPWKSAPNVQSAPLDRNQGLVIRTLEKHGLSKEAAVHWVGLANQIHDDPDNLVAALTAVREPS
ncbi:hypothetical protein L2Y94_11025 [Luteibacter aegosomatis]|uniref:hypothetical protein n=1 Tax=Luteibacter aegosomatis TaxID=2911537 RepID=UPI001FF9D1C3|nr:hypothetical protein [Luteibacter aegosomatis]UPG83891.1 hypothetical protein L2Y94_11025 [Luteibacter aegosomatis]